MYHAYLKLWFLIFLNIVQIKQNEWNILFYNFEANFK